MDSRSRVGPAEEAQQRVVMDGLGVYDAAWALSKVLEQSDVRPAQSRLLLTREMVRASPIPELFPELVELRDDGLNTEHRVPVTLLDAEGREKMAFLPYLNPNRAYRVLGPGWRRLVQDCGMSAGDRLDLYTCRRDDGDGGERCLFVFRTQGGGAGGSLGSDGRKRKRSLLRRK